MAEVKWIKLLAFFKRSRGLFIIDVMIRGSEGERKAKVVKIQGSKWLKF